MPDGSSVKPTFKRRLTNFLNILLRPLGIHTWASSEPKEHRRWFSPTEEYLEKRGDNNPPPIDMLCYQFCWFRLQNGLFFGFELSDDGENSINFHIELPYIMALFITIDVLDKYRNWIREITGQYGRSTWEIGIRSEYGIFLKWRENSNDCGIRTKPGWSWTLYWHELRGKTTMTDVELEKVEITFVQPAYKKSYQPTEHKATLTRKQTTWRWSNRLLRPMVRVHWDIHVEDGPQFEGKGESGHDLDPDSIIEMSADCDKYPTAEMAIQHYVMRIIEMRDRRG